MICIPFDSSEGKYRIVKFKMNYFETVITPRVSFTYMMLIIKVIFLMQVSKKFFDQSEAPISRQNNKY